MTRLVDLVNLNLQLKFRRCIQADLASALPSIKLEQKKAERFILATDVLDFALLCSCDVLRKYQAQQSIERGFRFLKNSLFFTSSVFLKSPRRVAALAIVMGLCLLSL